MDSGLHNAGMTDYFGELRIAIFGISGGISPTQGGCKKCTSSPLRDG